MPMWLMVEPWDIMKNTARHLEVYLYKIVRLFYSPSSLLTGKQKWQLELKSPSWTMRQHTKAAEQQDSRSPGANTVESPHQLQITYLRTFRWDRNDLQPCLSHCYFCRFLKNYIVKPNMNPDHDNIPFSKCSLYWSEYLLRLMKGSKILFSIFLKPHHNHIGYPGIYPQKRSYR